MLVALLAAAAALRPQLSGVGPLLGPIGRDLGVSHAVAGLLATIPVACMGLLAFASARLLTRHGSYRTMGVALGCICLGGGLRAVVPDAAGVILLTVVFGIGAGVAGTLLPAVVKARFASRSTEVTAAYAISLNGAAALSAAIAAPLAQIAGGWRGAVAVFGVWDLLLACVWVTSARTETVVPRLDGLPESAGSAPAVPVRGRERAMSPAVLAVVFGLQGTVYYGLSAWLAGIYRADGWGATSAGALVGVLSFSTLPATLAVGAFANRLRGRIRYLVLSSALLAGAMLGIAVEPSGGFAWIALAGLALGTIFPLCLAAPVELGSDPHEVTRATGVMLGGGYLIAAVAPLVLGALRDSSGSFTAGVWMLFGLSVALVFVCAAAGSVRGTVPAHV
jgi:CP family cyanate transporter-like MFS transporter